MKLLMILLLMATVVCGQFNFVEPKPASEAQDSLYVALTTVMPISLTGIQKVDGKYKPVGQVTVGYNAVVMAMRSHAESMQPLAGLGIGIETGYSTQAVAAIGALLVVSNFSGFVGYDFNQSGVKFGVGYTVLLGFPSAWSWTFYRRAIKT